MDPAPAPAVATKNKRTSEDTKSKRDKSGLTSKNGRYDFKLVQDTFGIDDGDWKDQNVIYKWTFTKKDHEKTGFVYIGQAQNLKKRTNEHLTDARRSGFDSFLQSNQENAGENWNLEVVARPETSEMDSEEIKHIVTEKCIIPFGFNQEINLKTWDQVQLLVSCFK